MLRSVSESSEATGFVLPEFNLVAQPPLAV